MPSEPLSLPLTAPAERADAARNRARILTAAERLIAEHGVDSVSMDAIADAAGVGKGTLFRRFGDRAGLLHALLDERERDLQERAIRGAPPLGPGAPPAERLVAFGHALAAHIEAHGELLSAAERGPWARLSSPVYAFYRTHVASLLREANPALDAEYFADVLLAPLAADFHLYLRRGVELPLERLAAGYELLVRRLVGCS